MSKRWRKPRATSALVLTFCLGVGVSVGGSVDAIEAGFGQAPLPTPENGPLAGYGGVWTRRAEGVLDQPQARAVVLDQEGLRVALVTLDLVIVRPQLRDALIERVTPLDIDALIVVATHTHSGPGGYIPGWIAERVTAGAFDADVPNHIVRTATRALERAVADLSAARSGSGRRELRLARNRRFADGLVETELPVIRIDAANGDPIVVFAYGAHPTVLSPRSQLYSADYVGAARAEIDAAGYRSLFLPGPIADQEPQSELGELWPRDVSLQQAQTKEIGSVLARAVLETLPAITTTPEVKLTAIERWLNLPHLRTRRFCAVWWFSPFLRGSLRHFFSERVPIHALRIDQAEIVTLPGEPTSWVARELRARLNPTLVPIVVSHANDWLGYITSPENYDRGGYEACASFYGRQLGPWLVDEAAETVRLLESRDSAEDGP